MAVPKVSELVRERETYKYATSLLAGLRLGTTRREPDSVLSALAELARLRIRGTRCLISIFDCGFQYIVAESFESASVNPPDRRDRPRRPSPVTVNRNASLCEHVITEVSLPPHRDASQAQRWVHDGDSDRLPVSVIQDTSLHASEGCEYDNRCYAGVPIKTDRGINIGVLCAFGSENSLIFDPASIALLQGMSKTIMDYLETRREADSNRRADRMVRGVGKFVDGSTAGMSWQDGVNAALTPGTSSTNNGYFDVGRTDQNGGQNGDDEQDRDPEEPTSLSLAEQKQPHRNERRPGDSASTTIETKDFGASSDGPQQLSDIFERASSIIRESIEVEGVVFFDARLSIPIASTSADANRSAERSSRNSSCSTGSRHPWSGLTDEAHVDLVCPTLGRAHEVNVETGDDASPIVMKESFLRRLLRRHPLGKVYDFDDLGSVQSSDSDEEKSGLERGSQDVSTTGSCGVKGQKRKDEGHRIASLFPGARSVVFFPLWDARKQRWYAGGFAYTCTPTRFFSVRSELSFLLAFGSTIMTEVFRSDAALVDVVKTNILNSISHELRSPLHGIVLGAEMMHDTQLSPFQEDLLHSVETCGRTLLDVIDQLMDWSKVKNIRQRQAGRGRRLHAHGRSGHKVDNKRESVEGGTMCATSDVNVDILAEEVVESVYAGYTFQRLSYEDFDTSKEQADQPLKRLDNMKAFETLGSQAYQSASSHKLFGNFSVTLDVDAAVPWVFHTQPGALRRIIMNLVGNSLKFTQNGAVHVRLRQTALPPGRNSNELRQVEITVADSGSGISEEYLNHRLYTAFSQENELMEGVGLGLSLVRQIARSMGGNIKIQSQPGTGTCIAVSLPMEPAQTLPSSIVHGDNWDEHVKALKGLRAGVVGFPTHSVQSQTFRGSTDAIDGHEIITVMCGEWLGMEVTTDEEDHKPDLLIVHEQALASVQQVSVSTPVVVVSRNPVTARKMARDLAFSVNGRESAVIDFTSEPVGPRKLAKVLSHTLKRWIMRQTSASPSDVAPSLSTTITSISSPATAPVLSVAADVEKAMPCARSTSGLDPRFLLVEDNVINMKILESYMKKLKMPYAIAKDGQQAVDAFSRCAESRGSQRLCVLMDISMPVMDGFQATRLIRAMERQKALAPCLIFALTGLASGEAQDEAFASGVDLFLTKPVKLKELTEILASRGLCG